MLNVSKILGVASVMALFVSMEAMAVSDSLDCPKNC